MKKDKNGKAFGLSETGKLIIEFLDARAEVLSHVHQRAFGEFTRCCTTADRAQIDQAIKRMQLRHAEAEVLVAIATGDDLGKNPQRQQNPLVYSGTLRGGGGGFGVVTMKEEGEVVGYE